MIRLPVDPARATKEQEELDGKLAHALSSPRRKQPRNGESLPGPPPPALADSNGAGLAAMTAASNATDTIKWHPRQFLPTGLPPAANASPRLWPQARHSAVAAAGQQSTSVSPAGSSSARVLECSCASLGRSARDTLDAQEGQDRGAPTPVAASSARSSLKPHRAQRQVTGRGPVRQRVAQLSSWRPSRRRRAEEAEAEAAAAGSGRCETADPANGGSD